MTTWPERPQINDRPVTWFSDGSVRPTEPYVGDFWEMADGRRYVWTGSGWKPEEWKV
jgi:hypothetical protein